MDWEKADRVIRELTSGGRLTEKQSERFIDHVLDCMRCRECKRFVHTWWRRLWHRIVCGKQVFRVP